MELILSLPQTGALTKIVLSCPVSHADPCFHQVSPEPFVLQKTFPGEVPRCDARNSANGLLKSWIWVAAEDINMGEKWPPPPRSI